VTGLTGSRRERIQTTLEVTGLVKEYNIGSTLRRRPLRAVDDVSFTLTSGQTVALVGESGSGKSTIARMLARLTRPTSGVIAMDGTPVSPHSRAIRRYRSDVQMVFQDPFSSLNPSHTVGYHLRRPLRLHGVARGRAAEDAEVLALLRRVSLIPAELYVQKYPYELSGGQRQRVAIARALAPRPKVLLADEPVSMLDVSIRLEILNLIDRLKSEDDLAVLYITHDLATARHFSSEILVMYRGAVVERGTSDEVILDPAHPYTSLLASAAPDPLGRRELLPLAAAGGTEAAEAARRPTGAALTGCRFAPRCPYAAAICAEDPPAFSAQPSGYQPTGPQPTGHQPTGHQPTGHRARCWLHDPQGRHPGRSVATVGR
jgi:peptide/nickel transport system ATP-binding protein